MQTIHGVRFIQDLEFQPQFDRYPQKHFGYDHVINESKSALIRSDPFA
jgi:hypothetical protein